MRFRSLQSRILFFFLGLFALVQAITFLAITTANWRSVNRQIEGDLVVSGRVFHSFIEEQASQLILSAKLLSGDFAFKQAYADGDRETLFSAVTNLQEHRIGADVMVLADADEYLVIIDTLHPASYDVAFPFPELIETAEETGEPSSALGTIDGRFYRLVVVPLLAPEPVAWITVGFLIDDKLADNLKQLTLTDVSFLKSSVGGGWSIVASTLSASLRDALASETASAEAGLQQRFTWMAEDERFVALNMVWGDQLRVVLQRSLDQALAPFERLYRILVVLVVFVLALSVAGGVLIARTVTRPVRTLVEGTKRIEQGDYHHQISIAQKDEIGRLAEAFNQMTRGLAAFQRYLPMDLVRTLISKGIESKPEARVATILFADIEGFTELVEKLSPERTVAMLNEYFSAVTKPIEKYGGVITQFQGDAILAVFNVPTDDPDHGGHAVRAALEIHNAVKAQKFADITLRNRVGINTGEVIAGSVGSENRVNYTVHGDAVNLAARLEALNKEYGTRVLMSQATADIIGDEFPYERIGEIEIRGKRAVVTVYKLA
ncbi:MAG: adenylate/guanylate cyclase domain-containing protein [Acidiferrobacterales bacterium]